MNYTNYSSGGTSMPSNICKVWVPPGMPRLSYVWGHAQSQLIYASLALSAIAVSLSHSIADYNADCLGLQNFLGKYCFVFMHYGRRKRSHHDDVLNGSPFRG